eukprot:5378463-Alexandrium_andersonii.AAC.1
MLRSIGDASMARADGRISEHLAQRVQATVEAVAAPVPRPVVGTGAALLERLAAGPGGARGSVRAGVYWRRAGRVRGPCAGRRRPD